MEIEKAIKTLNDILVQFRDMLGKGCTVKLWVHPDDIEAMEMAIEALRQNEAKEDDGK